MIYVSFQRKSEEQSLEEFYNLRKGGAFLLEGHEDEVFLVLGQPENNPQKIDTISLEGVQGLFSPQTVVIPVEILKVIVTTL